MASSSNHLALMNSVLSLAYNMESYPNHLFTAGYRPSRIEPIIKVRLLGDKIEKGERKLNPDIFFISGDRGLFAECKSGERLPGQNLKNYDQIAARHLIKKGIDIPNDNLELDVAIFANDNIEVIKDTFAREGIDYPQIKITEYIGKKYGKDFKDEKLRDLFNRSIELTSKPLLILKFDENSTLEEIAPFVFNTLMSRLVEGKVDFTTREFTEDVIGDIWSSFDQEFQRSLNNKVKSILNYCKIQREFKHFLMKKGEIWTINVKPHWKSRIKFCQNCEKMMRKLRQSRLTDFIDKKNETKSG